MDAQKEKESSGKPRLHQDATSLKIPASGDRLQSALKEDDDIRNLPFPGAELNPILSTRVKENLRKTFGTFDKRRSSLSARRRSFSGVGLTDDAWEISFFI